jgi:hypothetical protein
MWFFRRARLLVRSKREHPRAADHERPDDGHLRTLHQAPRITNAGASVSLIECRAFL